MAHGLYCVKYKSCPCRSINVEQKVWYMYFNIHLLNINTCAHTCAPTHQISAPHPPTVYIQHFTLRFRQFVREKVPLGKTVGILLVYCTMTPLGILTGMLAQLVQGPTGALITNFTQAFGSGTYRNPPLHIRDHWHLYLVGGVGEGVCCGGEKVSFFRIGGLPLTIFSSSIIDEFVVEEAWQCRYVKCDWCRNVHVIWGGHMLFATSMCTMWIRVVTTRCMQVRYCTLWCTF